jgi:hypothetical protein
VSRPRCRIARSATLCGALFCLTPRWGRIQNAQHQTARPMIARSMRVGLTFNPQKLPEARRGRRNVGIAADPMRDRWGTSDVPSRGEHRDAREPPAEPAISSLPSPAALRRRKEHYPRSNRQALAIESSRAWSAALTARSIWHVMDNSMDELENTMHTGSRGDLHGDRPRRTDRRPSPPIRSNRTVGETRPGNRRTQIEVTQRGLLNVRRDPLIQDWGLSSRLLVRRLRLLLFGDRLC